MSLATASVAACAAFQTIISHLRTKSRHGNMHLREACMRKGKRDLRYLHAMVARGNVIEGAISGPGVKWRYRLTANQLTVVDEQAPPKELSRMARVFVKEILERIRQEQGNQKHPVKRTKGQFYLMRQAPGSAFNSPACSAASAAGVLDMAFLRLLAGWDLLLFQH